MLCCRWNSGTGVTSPGHKPGQSVWRSWDAQSSKSTSRPHLCSATSARTHTQRIQPSNRYELFLKFSLSAKGRRSTDPITNFRAKVRMSPGMSLDTFKSTFQSIFQPPPHLTQSRTLFHRPDKGKPNS